MVKRLDYRMVNTLNYIMINKLRTDYSMVNTDYSMVNRPDNSMDNG